MSLLLLYFSIAIVISFVCSVAEAVLLSVNRSYISVLEKTRPKAGRLLRRHKAHINKSISSILILNTLAHTFGAAGVGAQAESIFGSSAVFYISVVLTLAILFISEIIPKTIGALYWKELGPTAAYVINFFIWITYPILVVSIFMTTRLTKGREGPSSLTKAELIENTLLSEDEGIIDEQESDVIENVLLLDDIKVKEILTPRSVVNGLEGCKTIREVIKNEDLFQFSRMPVYNESIDTITGIILTKNIFQQAMKDDTMTIKDLQTEIYTINENIPVSKALDLFIKKKEHIFLVVDSYDQTEGIITLEDCVETILGVEIMDESDAIEDMRAYAKLKMKIRRKQL
ncbi:MAG: CNNM domain-containing protein [Desulfobulbaceae bacterium]|jgi:CBS domain containing-hemolysin-like protein|nr:CNNM domain-containing protein [Desulfobulbaceae bacterium]